MNVVWVTLTVIGSMLILDGLWLGIVAKKMYRKALGNFLRKKPSFGAAGLFYILYAAGLSYFVIWPVLDHSWHYTLLRGMALGLLAFGTYDLTNQSTLKNWPKWLTAVDMLWGSVMTGLVSFIAYAVARAIV